MTTTAASAVSGQGPYASLAMYPFEPVRSAWDHLWSAVHEQVPWTPAALRWDGEVHEHWSDPQCVVAQVCGWPLVTTLRGHVAVVGAFTLDLPDRDEHRYRSVIMANRPVALAELVAGRGVAAVNSRDSLSGWISLLAAALGPGGTWPGPVVVTGGHVASLRSLREGEADVASIDALSLALVRRHEPDLAAGLHEIGRGPLVPSLPVVVRAGTPTRRIDELRRALAGAMDGPERAGVREALLVDGFVPLDQRDYEVLRDLAPALGGGSPRR